MNLHWSSYIICHTKSETHCFNDVACALGLVCDCNHVSRTQLQLLKLYFEWSWILGVNRPHTLHRMSCLYRGSKRTIKRIQVSPTYIIYGWFRANVVTSVLIRAKLITHAKAFDPSVTAPWCRETTFTVTFKFAWKTGTRAWRNGKKMNEPC